MSAPIRVLILEGHAADVELMLYELRRAGFDPVWQRAEMESDYVALLDPGLDIILADYSLPHFDAMRALHLLQEHGLDIPFIIVTGTVSEEAAVECMKQGVTDYIHKDRLARLGPAVKRGLEDRQLRIERKRAEQALRESEERFRIAAQSVSDVVWQWDIESGRLDWYGKIDALLGYEPDRFPRTVQAWEKIIHPDDHDRVMAALEAHFKDGRPYREEYRVFRKDSSLAHWRDIGMALRDDRGKVYQMIGAIADITKQIQAEEQLRRSEAALKKAQHVSHVGSWVWHIQTNRLEWSDEMYYIFGLDKENFSGNLSEVIERAIHPDDRAAVERAGLSVIKDKVPQPLEYRVLWPDGTVRVVWAEAGELILDEAGQPLAMTGIAQDITERKKAEDALRESEAKYRGLVDQSFIGIGMSHGNRVLFANPALLEIFGYNDLEEFIKMPLLDHVAPASRENIVARMGKVAKGEPLQPDFEHEIMRKDGKTRKLHCFSNHITVGSETYTQTVFQDITDRKQAEDRIQSLMREIEFILGATRTGLDIVDSKFNIHFVDPAWSKIRGDWRGRKCYDYFIGRRRPCLKCGLVQALRTREMVVREVVLPKEGQRPVQVISIPFQDENGEWLVAEVSVDITEHKRTEEALLASREELRSLSARLQALREEERTTLAREIHDELGQALTALNMDLSWLSNKLPTDPPSLLKKVESMSAVVATTMQTVKRLSSELRPGLLDDLGLVTAMQWQAEEFGKRTWLKMKIAFVPEEMAVERDLSTAIFRIFQELLTNIARHAKATRVEVSLKRKAGALELRVKDNGRGIKKSEIANSQSLGIIGIRERVLAFGGQVEIVGIPRKGTRVVVRLPERGKHDDKNPGG